MNIRQIAFLTLCATGVAFLGAALQDPDPTPSVKVAPVAQTGTNHRETDAITHRPDTSDATSLDKNSLAGFVHVWSGSTNGSPETSSTIGQSYKSNEQTVRSEREAAHAREVAQVSIRMLELQAKQYPSRADHYLQQAKARAQAIVQPLATPSRERVAHLERQRQVNAYMSSKIDRLRSAQRPSAAVTVGQVQINADGLRPGDAVAPRAGDLAIKSR